MTPQSVKLALGDPLLSQYIARYKPSANPDTVQQRELQRRAELIVRYAYQLSSGCGQPSCQQTWCRTAKGGPRLASQHNVQTLATHLAAFAGSDSLCSHCSKGWAVQQYALKRATGIANMASASLAVQQQLQQQHSVARWMEDCLVMGELRNDSKEMLVRGRNSPAGNIHDDHEFKKIGLVSHYYLKSFALPLMQRAIWLCVQASAIAVASATRRAAASRDFTLLSDSLLIAFSSPETLCSVFSTSLDKAIRPIVLSTSRSHSSASTASATQEAQAEDRDGDMVVDLAMARTAFPILVPLESSSALPLSRVVESLAERLAISPLMPSGVAAALLLLEHPAIASSLYASAFQKIVAAMAGMTMHSQEYLVQDCISSYDKEQFSRLVSMLVRLVERTHLPGDAPGNYVCQTLAVLELLYSAMARHKHLADCTHSFQSRTLSAQIDFRKEYQRWSERRARQSNGAATLLNWPFLFDVTFKSYVLQMHALTNMLSASTRIVMWQDVFTFCQRHGADAADAFADIERRLYPLIESHLVLELNRTSMTRDILDQLSKRCHALDRPLRVKFVNGGEEGVDQGGLQKEMFQVVALDLFDPKYGMFVYDEGTRTTLFNHHSFDPPARFELLGTFLGLACYNGVLLDVGFPRVFASLMLGHRLTLAGLAEFAPDVARGLQQLLDWDQGSVEEVFCLTFAVDEHYVGEISTVELVSGGSALPVTEQNRREYVQLYVQHLEQRYFGEFFQALRRGFFTVCDSKLITHLFEPDELYSVLCGSTELDFAALEQNTTYEDGFSADHPVIRDFWRVVHGMDPEQQREFLRFTLASARAPPRGLCDVRFSIQRNGPDTDRLPSAYTCFGRLLLPEYRTYDKLRDRLLTAIHNYAGFGLV